VLVERSDRLAREHHVDQLIVLELANLNTQVIEIEGGTDLTSATDPTTELMRNLLSIASEWQKDTLVYNQRKARERKRREEGRCEGVKPFGHYTREKAAYQRLLELAVQKLTFDQIAQRLDQEGHRPRSSKRWTRAAVWKIVRRAQKQGEIDGG